MLHYCYMFRAIVDLKRYDCLWSTFTEGAMSPISVLPAKFYLSKILTVKPSFILNSTLMT